MNDIWSLPTSLWRCTSAFAGIAAGVVLALTQRSTQNAPTVTPVVTATTAAAEESKPKTVLPLPEIATAMAATPRDQMAFANALTHLDSDGCAALVEKWSRPIHISGAAAQRACALLFRHWSTIDPERATARLLKMRAARNVGTGRQFVQLAAEGWGAAAANDPEVRAKTLPLLAGSSNRGTQELLVRGLFGGIEAPDFAETVRRAKTLREELPTALAKSSGINNDDNAIAAILNQWYRPPGLGVDAPNSRAVNPLDIYHYATGEIDNPKLRAKAQEYAFRHLAQLDPALAATTLSEDGFPELLKRNQSLIGSMAAEWCNRDLDAAVQWILDRPGEERDELLGRLTGFGQSMLEPRDVFDLLQRIPRDNWPEGAVVGATRQWSLGDPVAALEWFGTQPESKDPERVKELTENLWFRDWESGLQGLRQLAKIESLPANAYEALVSTVRNVCAYQATSVEHTKELDALRDAFPDSDLAAAIDAGRLQANAWRQDPSSIRQEFLAAANLSDEQRNDVLGRIASNFSLRESLADTLAWTETLPPNQANIAIGYSLTGHLTRSPEEAIPFAMDWLGSLPEDQMEDTRARAVAARAVDVIIDSTGDWQTAAQWAATEVPEPLRDAAMGKAIEVWAQTDPFGAAEWMSTQPPGSVGDKSISRLIKQIAWDPEQAFAWGTMLSSPETQVKQLGKITEEWSLYAPDAARSAIEASGLSPETKASLLKSASARNDE